MKVTNRIISIPPYISTTWRHVHSIHMKDDMLIITLTDQTAVRIPNLQLAEVELIFKAHQAHLESAEADESKGIKGPSSTTAGATQSGNPLSNLIHSLLSPDASANPQVRIAFGSLDSLGTMLQHNPAQADAPSLPPDLLGKVASMAKWISPEDAQNLPKAEPHCNCFHCQLARAMAHETATSAVETPAEAAEAEVKEDDLRFQQWQVEQTGDNLYHVTNKLDRQEQYSVFLGHPMGCTCGKEGCEHIIAVLQS